MISARRLTEVCKVISAELHGDDVEYSSVYSDTRELVPHSLFVALKGESYDGHMFLSQAKQAGAVAAIVAELQDVDLPQLLVTDTLKAYGLLANYERRCSQAKIVALTGSMGKTTTKEMLACIFTQQGQVLATKGNYNNEIGVPHTLMRLTAADQFAVIEMGAAKQGDIAYLMNLVEPDIALVTNASSAHVSGFGSLDGVAKGKGEAYSKLAERSLAVINLDDEYAEQWIAMTATKEKLLFSAQGDVRGSVRASDQCVGTAGTSFILEIADHTPLSVNLKVPGYHNINNAIAAAAVAYGAGISPALIRLGLEQFTGVEHRLQVVDCGDLLVLDDSYNANPVSLMCAIDVLSCYQGRTFALLGDMAELGDEAISMHKEVAEYAKHKGIESIFVVGELWQQAVEDDDSVVVFESVDALVEAVEKKIDGYSVALVKGSRSSRMERVVAALKASYAA